MGVRLKNVDEIVTSGGQTLDVTQTLSDLSVTLAAASAGGGNSIKARANSNITKGAAVGMRPDGEVEMIVSVDTTDSYSGNSISMPITPGRMPGSMHWDDSNNVVFTGYRQYVWPYNNHYYAVGSLDTSTWQVTSPGSQVLHSNGGAHVQGDVCSGYDHVHKRGVLFYQDAGGNHKYRAGIVTATSFGGSEKNGEGYHVQRTVYDEDNDTLLVFQKSGSTGYIAPHKFANDTTLTFNSGTSYNGNTNGINVIKDPNSNKYLMIYSADNARTEINYFTLSGTTITLNSTPHVIKQGAGGGGYSICYHDDEGKFVIAGLDSDASRAFTCVIDFDGTQFSQGPIYYISDKTVQKHIGVQYHKTRKRLYYIGGEWHVYYTSAEIERGNELYLHRPIHLYHVANGPNFSGDIITNQSKTEHLAFVQTSTHGGVVYHLEPEGFEKKTNARSFIGYANNNINAGDIGDIAVTGLISDANYNFDKGVTYYLNHDGSFVDSQNTTDELGTYGEVGEAFLENTLLLAK